ncbi:putative non-specific serine/threonine protein kinase [Helianthus annuus]|nr:putative non-specific serine/threonine protein kinase [Helianthus annuus]
MSATIPEELGNLASIERLFLNSNSFSGTLLASFANLNTIKEFRIGGNNFSGKIPDYIGRWQSLKSL